MFYGTFVLAKKGPLAKVWLAAHWDKKLTKAHIFDTDVEKTVEDIISPKVKLALRTSGHLLLGVVRIYSRKQKYLVHDLGEACAKIRMAFRPGVVDLPAEAATARTDAITIPEMFHDFESAIVNVGTMAAEEQFTINPTRAAEITMTEEIPTTSANAEMFDNYDLGVGFGEDTSEVEIGRDAAEISAVMDRSISTLPKPTDLSTAAEKEPALEPERPVAVKDNFQPDIDEGFGLSESISMEISKAEEDGKEERMDEEQQLDSTVVPEKESFVLEPVDEPVVKERRSTKRKRKLVVDQTLSLTSSQIRDQLQSCDDLLIPKCFPPPTKKALTWKEIAGCDQLFSKPTCPFITAEILEVVTRNYTTDISEGQQETIDLEAPEEERSVLADQLGGKPMASPGHPCAVDDLPSVAPDEMANDEVAGIPPIEMEGDFNIAVPEETEEGKQDKEETLVPSSSDVHEADSDGNDAAGSNEGKLDDEVEQRRWTKRTHQVLRMITRGLEDEESINFKQITKNCNRKLAASRFYTCLLLAKEGTIQVEQSKPFADIYIHKGSAYTKVY